MGDDETTADQLNTRLRLDVKDHRSAEEGKNDDDMEKNLNLSQLDDTTRTNSLEQKDSQGTVEKEVEVPIRGKWLVPCRSRRATRCHWLIVVCCLISA